MARDKLGKSCSLWYCNDKHYAMGLCHRHYENVRKYGGTISPKNTDLKNALRMVNELVYAIKKSNNENLVKNTFAKFNDIDNINVIGRCNKCKMDKTATLWWPNVTISCGCPGESIIRLDEKEFDLPDLFMI